MFLDIQIQFSDEYELSGAVSFQAVRPVRKVLQFLFSQVR
jgi:hypothetical protein